MAEELLTMYLIPEDIRPLLGASNVRLIVHKPADKASIAAWEQRNAIHLPYDLKSFYFMSDGMDTEFIGSDKDNVHINPINALQLRIGFFNPEEQTKPQRTTEYLHLINRDEEITQSEIPNYGVVSLPVMCPHSKIYELATHSEGRFFLVPDSRFGTSIWYLDRALEWHFAAPNFMAFFRRLLQGSLGSIHEH